MRWNTVVPVIVGFAPKWHEALGQRVAWFQLLCFSLAQDYADYTGKFGAAGVGVLAALLSVARGKRRLAW